jgi:hypothetical protein
MTPLLLKYRWKAPKRGGAFYEIAPFRGTVFPAATNAVIDSTVSLEHRDKGTIDPRKRRGPGTEWRIEDRNREEASEQA